MPSDKVDLIIVNPGTGSLTYQDLASNLTAVEPPLRAGLIAPHIRRVAALPDRTLREEAVDFACNGEGPVTVEQLLTVLKNGSEDYSKVEGLVWRDGKEIRNNIGAKLITDLDKDLPGSAWDLLPMKRYRAHNWQCFGDLESRKPYASIYTTLGCPYRCTFCSINAPFGKPNYRMRSPKVVVDEMEHLYKTYGVRTFKIVDEMFVLNDRHVSGICNLLIERGLGAKFNIC